MKKCVKVALIQLACGVDVNANIAKTEERIREAAAHGANIVCLQELFNTQYFPQHVDVKYYSLAEPLPSPTTERMGRLAGELGLVIIVPIFEEAQPGVYFNSVVIYDADGRYLGKYRKNHIPDGPQYLEKYYFTPGDLGYPIFNTKYGKLAVGICWDQWFPEAARIFALQGAEIIFYPTAIGSEPDRPDYSSANAWRTIIRAHGIANGVFVAAANRVGVEQNMTFYGQSFISDPFGDCLAQASDQEELIYAELDYTKIRELRDLFQFFRDRRVETYSPILKKVIE
ncbi:MAG: carbon-nitrogen hydrolase [Anaerolineaceae bacterium]|nr:carbon-nitrogen hydrolase [Anaerolineaceae bacterium]MCB9099851.1 carbon-nitrogen hydrolase [Anaerolineales bacterium]